MRMGMNTHGAGSSDADEASLRTLAMAMVVTALAEAIQMRRD